MTKEDEKQINKQIQDRKDAKIKAFKETFLQYSNLEGDALQKAMEKEMWDTPVSDMINPSTSTPIFMVFDISQPDKKPEVIMKKYEIWTGYYHLGQGHHGSTEPEKWGEEMACNFKTACMKHELKSSLKRLEEGEQKGNLNMQDYEWFWNPHTNTNGWIGKYYETKEEALKAMNK